jgi:hypothetical protein
VVRGNTQPFTAASLAALDVLVIANPLAERNLDDWSLPTPSAFTPAEIAAVRGWVEGGGALLLIADHMPFPGAAGELAATFGIEMRNGFAVTDASPTGIFTYHRSDGSLRDHPITAGRFADERVDSVRVFTGSAFRPVTASGAGPGGGVAVEPLMVLPAGAVSLEPEEAWVFDPDTPREEMGGWLQGVALSVGQGRVVVLGEAAMLSAQLAGPQQQPMGMNAPEAAQNPIFGLNLVRWLVGARERGDSGGTT